jgi:hypothetical protein
MLHLISIFVTQARTALLLYLCYDHEVDSQASTGQGGLNAFLSRHAYLSNVLLSESC